MDGRVAKPKPGREVDGAAVEAVAGAAAASTSLRERSHVCGLDTGLNDFPVLVRKTGSLEIAV